MISAVFLTSLILLIWLRTDAFNEYMTLFGMGCFFYLLEYNELGEGGFTLTYPEFLEERAPSFFTRLINCPICLSVWLGFFFSFFVGIHAMPIISVLGLMIYLITDKLF